MSGPTKEHREFLRRMDTAVRALCDAEDVQPFEPDTQSETRWADIHELWEELSGVIYDMENPTRIYPPQWRRRRPLHDPRDEDSA